MMRIRMTVRPYEVMERALDAAIDRGIRRHDKYAHRPVCADIELLKVEIMSSFWLALEDAGVTLD